MSAFEGLIYNITSLYSFDPGNSKPSQDQVLQYSKYGFMDLSGSNNCLVNQFNPSDFYTWEQINTFPPPGDMQLETWLNYMASSMEGDVWVSLEPTTSAQLQQMTLFGLDFLPWNRAPYLRVAQASGSVYPINPFAAENVLNNAVTIGKLVLMLIALYFGSKFLWRHI